MQAAVAGLGIAITSWDLVQNNLTIGLLAAPFGIHAAGSSYRLLATRAFAPTSAMVLISDWLCDIAKFSPNRQ